VSSLAACLFVITPFKLLGADEWGVVSQKNCAAQRSW